MPMKSVSLTVLLLSITIAVAAQDNNRPVTPRSLGSIMNGQAANPVTVQEDIVYGVQGGEKLLLDLYQPGDAATQPRPAVVLIHGGGWTDLNKSTMRGMGNFLARSGYVAISVNYRLLHGSENRWPAQLDDVQRAVRWLRASASKYDVDPNRIGAFGHSSGAQLAALLGMEDTRDNSDPELAKYSSRVRAVVDVSGPVDFVVYGKAHTPGQLANLFGGDYDKIPDVWRDASPVYHVNKADAHFLIVHGTQDDNVAISQAQEFYDKLQKAGVAVSFVKFEEGHTFQTEEARRLLALQTLTFFNDALAANP
jgi:acetyl esterase/lipase